MIKKGDAFEVALGESLVNELDGRNHIASPLALVRRENNLSGEQYRSTGATLIMSSFANVPCIRSSFVIACPSVWAQISCLLARPVRGAPSGLLARSSKRAA